MSQAAEVVETAAAADEGTRIARQRASEGKRQEARLGLLLCAPAVLIMVAVMAYPIFYAVYLSFFRADLRTPGEREFVWLDNYITVLSSGIWWRAFWVTMFITVVGAFFQLVLGMLYRIPA